MSLLEAALVCFLLVVEQRSALGVGLLGAPPLDLLAGPGGDGNAKGREEEQGHDDKGEDPLQSNNLAGELSDTNGSSESAEPEAHGVVL